MDATAWFRRTMDELRGMPSPTRADLEAAAVRHFARLNADLDRPRHFHPDHTDEHIALNIEASRARVEELEDQLRQNIFDAPVQIAAARLAAMLGLDIATFNERQTIVAGQLAARAEREQLRRLVHQLGHDHEAPFVGDPLFDARSRTGQQPAAVERAAVAPKPHSEGRSLKTLSEDFLRRKERTGVQPSQLTELARALRWLREELGDDRAIVGITKDELRAFRDAISKLDVTLRGRDVHFRDRLTNQQAHQIKSVTAKRYWNSIQAFFDWAVNEGHLNASLAAGLSVDSRRNEVKRTPPPLSPDEVRALLATPLYAGCKSARRLLEPGPYLAREGGHWWSGVLALFTGMRAGELSQLEASNFDFAATVPSVSVTTLDASGEETKKAKTRSSVRRIPLHPVLLELGLQQFVGRRAHYHPDKRLFFEFRLGSTGRTSEGLTAFWGRYLRKVALWSEGRATHMFRHTVADRLRANGATDEDIGAILGHSGRTITAGYGGAQPLGRKAHTMAKLDYGFDVVAILKGNEARLASKQVDAALSEDLDGGASVV